MVTALVPLIEQFGAPSRLMAKGFTNMFASLARSIIYQQLATGAATAIHGRFLEACKVVALNHNALSPKPPVPVAL